MLYTVKTIPQFDREAKRLVKKYPSLKEELHGLILELKNDPEKGTPLGNSVFKIRLAVSSKGKGKRSGVRIITYVVADNKTILLLSIYDKGEKDSISDNEIKRLLDY